MPRKPFTAVTVALAATAGMLLTAPTALAAPDDSQIVQAGSTIFIPDALVGEQSVGKCTVGFVKNGEAYTAAHCVKPGESVYNSKGKRIGKGAWSYASRGVDLAGIKLSPGVQMRDTPVSETTPAKGAEVYKYGSTTGVTDGEVIDGEPDTIITGMSLSAAIPITIPMPAHTATAALCSQPGDSGGPVVDKESETVVGVVSSIDEKTAEDGCHDKSVTYYTPVTWE